MLLASRSIKYGGELPRADEEISAFSNSMVVLVEHVFRVFSKDLQSETLHDIHKRILYTIDTLVVEAENTAEARSVNIKTSNDYLPLVQPSSLPPAQPIGHPAQVNRAVARRRDRNNFSRRRDQTTNSAGPPTTSRTPATFPRRQQSTAGGPPCQLCVALKRPQAGSHSISACLQIPPA